MTSQTFEPFRTRTQVLFASEANRAVILRRGPKRHFNLIMWDLKTDTFTPGQWMKGIVKLCDLSPKGDKLLYWAAQYHASAPRDLQRVRVQSRGCDGISGSYDPALRPLRPKKRRPGRKTPRYLCQAEVKTKRALRTRNIQGVWTAVSTPPYFSALAIWPCFGHWTGGGVFHSNREIVLFEDEDGMGPVENTPLPSSIRIRSIVQFRKRGIEPSANAYRPEFDQSADRLRVEKNLIKAGCKFVDWINVRTGKDLLFACDGCVYRLSDWKKVPESSYLDEAQLLTDLRPLQFQLIRAPGRAMRWN